MAIKITSHNQKGGTLKTTTIVAIASYLAKSGKKVLLVDLDPQGNCMSSFNQRSSALKYTIFDLYFGTPDKQTIPVEKVIIDVYKNFDIIPSNNEMMHFDKMSTTLKLKKTLAEIIAEVEPKYDFILFDTSATLSINTISALKLTDILLIPFIPDTFGFHGMINLLQILNEEIEGLKIKNMYLIPTKVLHNAAIHAETIEGIKRAVSDIQDWESNVVVTDPIPQSTSASRAVGFRGLPEMLTNDKSKATTAFKKISELITGVKERSK